MSAAPTSTDSLGEEAGGDCMSAVYNHIRRAETLPEDVTTEVPNWSSRDTPPERMEAIVGEAG